MFFPPNPPIIICEAGISPIDLRAIICAVAQAIEDAEVLWIPDAAVVANIAVRTIICSLIGAHAVQVILVTHIDTRIFKATIFSIHIRSNSCNFRKGTPAIGSLYLISVFASRFVCPTEEHCIIFPALAGHGLLLEQGGWGSPLFRDLFRIFALLG